MNIRVTRQGKTCTIQLKEGTIRDILEKLDINPETVLSAREGKIVPETAPLQQGDRIELIQVISGG